MKIYRFQWVIYEYFIVAENRELAEELLWAKMTDDSYHSHTREGDREWIHNEGFLGEIPTDSELIIEVECA